MTDTPVALITGATNGIGEATALELARRGYDLGIICRNPTKGEATRERIAAVAPSSRTELFLADFTDLESVRAVVAPLIAAYPRVHVLVNNAGIHNPEHRVPAAVAGTAVDGVDEMIVVNYLAPFLLTHGLLPHLVGQGPVRVVNVASEAHRLGHRASTDLVTAPTPEWSGTRDSYRYYGKSKLLDILFTFELARRLAGTDVTANCLCPGMVDTGLVAESTVVAALSRLFVKTGVVRTPARGARMSVRLATDPALAGETGRFFTSTAVARPLPAIAPLRDVTLQGALWEATERVLGLAPATVG